MRRLFVLVAALILLVAACTRSSDPTTTTSTTTPPTTVTTTVTGANGEERQIVMPDCDSAPDEVEIVCEVVDLVTENYVDQIGAADLARAAVAELDELGSGETTEPLVCPLPTEDFKATCEAAGELGLDSATTAEAIVASLISGALDPNSGYLDPESVAKIDEEDSGQIEGIGALVNAEDPTIEGENKQCLVITETCRIVIVGTFEGAPAREAGLLPEDVIVGVDGESIIGLSLDEVTSRVRGPAGTPVALSIERDGEVFEVTIVRAAVDIPALEYDVIEDIGYVKLYQFSPGADAEFEQAVIDLLGDGVRHLVFDLRDNPGGYLDTAIGIASVFLEDGEVVVTEGPGIRIPYTTVGSAVVPDDITVDIVVNRASASASEVVSGVLQERGRATVYGENTFGKNTVQQRFNLSNGGALRLTIARWVTPEGHDFGGVGITPDVVVDIDPLASPAEVVAAVLEASKATVSASRP
ncbi:MAG TPA: S41 family peptidase [Acidimicrobiia bacterium]